MKTDVQVVVVGTGFAGMAAADTLVRHGVSVLMIDENRHWGGQIMGSPGVKSQARFEADPMKRLGKTLAAQLERNQVGIMRQSQVLGIFNGHRLMVLDSSGKAVEIRADMMLIAAGAREAFLPFRGWTLPGVISTGGAQILMKRSGILPARKTLVGGTGPLQLVLAAELVRNTGQVFAVLDRKPFRDGLKLLSHWRFQWPRLLEGALYLARLAREGVPVRYGMGIVEARGTDRLREVVAARLGRDGQVVPGTETIYQTGCLAVGYGFVPNSELPLQAGCDVVFDRDRGGWVVSVNSRMETSVPGIFAAGEVTGIAGAKKSFIEGRIASLGILEALGKLHGTETGPVLRRLGRHRQIQLDYGVFLNGLSHVPAAAFAAIPDDVIICRCEEVTMGEIRGAVARGFVTAGGVKKATRGTMGRCQGRICGPVIRDIITGLTMTSPDSVGPTSVRFPVKSVSMDAFAQARASGDAADDPMFSSTMEKRP